MSVALVSLTLSAQEVDKATAIDSLSALVSNTEAVVSQLSGEVNQLKSENADLAASNEDLKKRLRSIERTLSTLQGESKEIQDRVENTERGVELNKTSISETQTGLSEKINTTDDKLNLQAEAVKTKTIWGLIIAFVVLMISAILTLILNKKGNVKIADLQNKADKLNEEIVNKLSSEVIELQKITSNIGTVSTVAADDSAEQELIKALADKITFMEMTLYKMDKSVRGHKHLTRSISQMKDNLLANGYEIVDMLGKPYHSGMKVTANFVDDDTLEEGAQIITGIVKPQINYKDKVIQTAQITVSQNI